jgi:hypothetical protein
MLVCAGQWGSCSGVRMWLYIMYIVFIMTPSGK